MLQASLIGLAFGLLAAAPSAGCLWVVRHVRIAATSARALLLVVTALTSSLVLVAGFAICLTTHPDGLIGFALCGAAGLILGSMGVGALRTRGTNRKGR